jgi:predicted ester cyclase
LELERKIVENKMKEIVEKLHNLVWSKGVFEEIESLVAPAYTIYSDPGDPWEGQTLDRETYRIRVLCSRTAFPDLIFKIQKIIAENNLVAVIWSAEGTHQGDLVEIAATGKYVSFNGQTFYEIKNGLASGHWQTVDRLGFINQFRPKPDR